MAAEQRDLFKEEGPPPGVVDSDEATVRAAEQVIQDGFAKKKFIFKLPPMAESASGSPAPTSNYILFGLSNVVFEKCIN